MKILCGTPTSHCNSMVSVDKKSLPGHGSPEEAFKCHCRYLLATGWTRIGPREFLPPSDGSHGTECRTLTKQSRFGARTKNGKNGSDGASKRGNRQAFYDRTGGTIISV